MCLLAIHDTTGIQTLRQLVNGPEFGRNNRHPRSSAGGRDLREPSTRLTLITVTPRSMPFHTPGEDTSSLKGFQVRSRGTWRFVLGSDRSAAAEHVDVTLLELWRFRGGDCRVEIFCDLYCWESVYNSKYSSHEALDR